MATIGFKAKDQKLKDDFSDFNFDDMGFDAPEVKDDRHPVIKTLSPVGRGAKDYITNSNNIERFVRMTMPKGYGEAYDTASGVKDDLKELYNNAAQELKPVKDTAKSFLRKALPTLDGKIPKGLHEQLKKLSKEDEQWQGSQGDGRDKELAGFMTAVFEQGAKDKVAQRNETNEREKIKQSFDQIRHRQTNSQLDAIRIAAEAQVQYQNKVTFNVQKKQLELSYRMFWAMADLNKEQKKSNAEIVTALKETVKNTGLPDYVKLTSKEAAIQMLRNKFLTSAPSMLFGGAGDFFKKFIKNVGENAMDKVRGVSGMAGMAGGMAEGMEGMPGMNMKDEIVSQLMHFPMEWLADKAAKGANKLANRSSKTRRIGDAAGYYAATGGDRFKEYLTSDKRDWKKLDGLRQMFIKSLPTNKIDTQMQTDSLGKAHEAQPWTRASAKTLNEVIPGLLSRIHREIKILRTGDENTPLVTYDLTKNKFSTDQQMAADFKAKIIGARKELKRDKDGKIIPEKDKFGNVLPTSQAAANANEYASKIIGQIDRGGKLTPEQRERARKMLIEKSVKGVTLDHTNVTSKKHWGDDADGEAIAASFKGFLRSDDKGLAQNRGSWKRQMGLLNDQKNFGNSLGDPRSFIQQLINNGQLEVLQQMGIVNEKNEFNRDAYAQWMTEDNTPAQPAVVPQTARAAASTGPMGLGAASIPQTQMPRGKKNKSKRQQTAPSTSTLNLQSLSSGDSTVSRHGEDIVNELRTISASLAQKQDGKSGDGSTIEKNVQTITDLLTALDEKYTHAADANYSMLTAMLQRLSEIATKGDGKAGAQAADEASLFSGGRQRAYTSLWEHLKGSAGDSLRKAKVYGRMAKRKGMQLWNKYSPVVEQKVERGLNGAVNMGKKFGNKLSSLYGDVIVNGENFPRLRANLLQAGEYRDKLTGRVITSLEDITGDVVDSKNNLVITMDEFYDSYVTGTINKKVKELFTKAKSKLEDWKTRLQSFVPQKLQQLKDAALGAFNKVKQMLPPYDVYVKTDMRKPILYANLMRFERYFSQKTGKPIKHPRDIDGPVIDEAGNVVLSEDHLKEGIVDVKGDPAGKGLGRILRKGARHVAAAWEMMREAAVGIFGAVKGGLGNVGEYFKNFFAPFTDMITNSRKTVSILESIRDMLDKRLPGGKHAHGDTDGDGIRDGSIEDQHRKRDAALKAAGPLPTITGSGKSTKVEMLLEKMVKSMARIEHHEEEQAEGDHESMLSKAADAAELYDDLRGNRGSPARTKAAKTRLKRMKAAKAGKAGWLRRGAGAVWDGAKSVGTLGKGMLTGNAGTMGRGAMGVGSAALKGVGAAASGVGTLAAGAGRWATGGSKLAKAARWGMFNTDVVKGIGKGVGGLAKMAPMAMKGLGLAGTAYSAYSAYDNFKQGNYGSAALDAGMAGVGAVTTFGGVSGLAAAGGAIAGGIGTVLASPFLVPALAVAGVGALAYLGYKQLQKTRLTNLSKIRLAQYGVKDDDKDGVEKMFALEEMLLPAIQLKDDGNIYLDEKKIELKEVAELMEVSRKADMELFNMWYRRRFVPVFRRWLTEVRKVDKEGKLAKIETIISPKDKLQVAESVVNGCSDAYSHRVGWNQSRSKLAYGSIEEVMTVLDSVRAALMKEREADGGEKAKVENRDSATSSTTSASALAQKALTDKANYTVKDKDGKTVDVTGMEVGQLTEKIKKGEVSVAVAVTVPQNLLQTAGNGSLDALTSIRYKAYGLSHMSADKARTLYALEMFVADAMTADTDNPKLNTSTDRVMQVAGEVFGVPNETGEHANRWKAWFNGRFLPVFLLWAGTIRKKTGKSKIKEASDSFPLAEQLALARAIIGAKGMSENGAKTSVWNISSNPWSDAYTLNSDSDSTAGNVEAIRQLTDKVRLGEVTANVAKPGKEGEKPAVDPTKPFIGYRDPLGRRKTTGGQFGSVDGKGINATGDKIVSGDGKPLAGMGEPLRFGNGGSGNYTDLPTPSGSGWGANKELILKAAAMAGVDPKALIATIAVESGFDPQAAPKNPNLPSSAKGLGQHLDSSWNEDLSMFGKKFGIPNGTNQFDARASALMTASRLQANGQALQKSLGRQVTVTDLYLAHLMGLAGATKFLKSPPDEIAADVAGAAAKQHKDYFFDKSGKPLTVKESYALFAQKLSKRPAEFGVTDADMASTNPASKEAGSAAGAPAGAAPAQAGAAAGAPGAAPQGQSQAAPAAPAAPSARGGAAGGASSATVPSAGSPQLNAPVVMDKGKAAVMGTGPAMPAGNGAKYELFLQREDSEDDGTYGTLKFPDGTVLNTLELPWRDNQAQISCIPPGQYDCKKRPSEHFGAAYEVQKVPGRSGVLIHAGNAAGDPTKGMKADSKGCILLGMDRGRKGNQKVITASKAAMQLFYEKMQDQPFTLIVRNGKNNTASSDKKSVSFDPVRTPAVNASGGPTQETSPQAQSAAPLTSTGAKANTATAAAPLASSTDLPRLNTTPTALSPTTTKQDMQGRDAAASNVIAPKIDGIANTLLKSLEAQTAGVDVLKEILKSLGGNKEADKVPEMSSGKVKPPSTPAVPVPQRRTV